MYSHHLRSLARRFGGSSEKGVATCEENVEAHAAIPKYIRKIKKRNVLRWEMLKGARRLRGWTFFGEKLFFFGSWNNLWAEKSPMKWVERGLIRTESYIESAHSPARGAQPRTPSIEILFGAWFMPRHILYFLCIFVISQSVSCFSK